MLKMYGFLVVKLYWTYVGKKYVSKKKKSCFLDFRKILSKQQINASKHLAYQSRLI